MVYLRLSRLRWSRCDDAGTISMARDAIVAAESANADAVRIWAGAYLGAAMADEDASDAGLEVLQRSCDEAEMRQMHWIAAAALRLEMDVLIRALRLARSALLNRLRRVPGMSPGDEAVAGCIEATVAFGQGDVARCVMLVEGAQKLARRAGQEQIAEEATLLRAAAHLAADELVAAHSLLPSVESASPAMVELLLPLAVTLDIVEGNTAAAAEKAHGALTTLSGTDVGAVVSDACVRAYVAAMRLDEAEQFSPARTPSAALRESRIGSALRVWSRCSRGGPRTRSACSNTPQPHLRAPNPDGRSCGHASCSRVRERPPARWTRRRKNWQPRLRCRPGGHRSSSRASPAKPYGAASSGGGPAAASPIPIALPERHCNTTARCDRRRRRSRHGRGPHGQLARVGRARGGRQQGAMSAPDALTAAFDVAGTDDTWIRALRFAIGLRDKGTLLDMQVSAGVAAAVR